MSDVSVSGVVSLIFFYLAILSIGIYASWRRKKNADLSESAEDKENEVILAGRNIGLWIGCFTMTATWVGGGYINGTAEVVYSSGLVWSQAPWGYAVSLICGGLFFAEKMREAEYVTMLDPLQAKYGNIMGGILYIPAFLGETFWSASILSALGSTLSVILHINMSLSVILSACIAVGYTLFGGLYAVAYTDVVQLGCIVIGLFLTLPFALTHARVTSISIDSQKWIGKLEGYEIGTWFDYAALLICGGIPWQVYFQRVLSSQTSKNAKFLSFVGAAGCFIMAIPAALLGAVAKSADWTNLPVSGLVNETSGEILDQRLVLPMVLQYLTPGWVAFIGLGAISAAVMSSADSSVLSASSMFGHNIYKVIFRPNASANEIIWVIRGSILFVAVFATVIGLSVPSIYILFHLCSDLVFVILFPQLASAVYIPFVNTYGSICAAVIGLFFRLTGGEPLIGLPSMIKYPMYHDGHQNFPFRTLSMLISFATLVGVSQLWWYLYDNGHITEKHDFAGVIQRREIENSMQNAVPLSDVKTKDED